MEEILQIEPSTMVRAIQGILLRYANKYWDDMAEGLVWATTCEAAYSLGYRDHGNDFFIQAQATKAVELLALLPQFRTSLKHEERDLPLTRKSLWKIIIEGLDRSTCVKHQALGSALLKPAILLSKRERNALKEALKDGFESLSQPDADSLYLLVKACPKPHNEIVLRGMLQAIVRHGSIATLETLIQPKSAE